MAKGYGSITLTNIATITNVDIYYAKSTSSSNPPTSGWDTVAPTWENGKYIWQKTVTTYDNNSQEVSDPICITGEKGATGGTGAAGRGITSITEEYYLSTSSSSPTGGSWSTTQPPYETGKFYWVRSKVVWENPAGTTYSPSATGVLAGGITTANETASSADATAKSAETKAGEALSKANTAKDTADAAQASANGKNTIFYGATKPVANKNNDVWFKYDNNGGYSIQYWNASSQSWTNTPLDGGLVIKDASITNAKIVNLDGNKITANSITANQLATDAIKSKNYQASGNASSPYSAIGTFINLADGNIYTPNFGVDSVNGKAYVNGEIIATSGTIGDDATNSWSIGTYTDWEMNDYGSLIANGDAFIQTKKLMLSNDRLNTQYFYVDTSDGDKKKLTYLYNPKDTSYYDYGLMSPELDTTTSGYIEGISDLFLYIRRHKNTIPSLETEWEYLFKVDKDGTVYEKGQPLSERYASIDGVSGAYLPLSGGTITGNLTVNGTLTAVASKAKQLEHSISVNGKSFDGSANVDVGTLGVGYGGTGSTTANGAANNLLSALPAWTATATDSTYLIRQDTGNQPQFGRVTFGTLWTYIKNKINADTELYTDKFVPKTGGAFDGALFVNNELYADSATFGSTIVNGNLRVVGDILGNVTGDVTGNVTGSSGSVKDSGNGTLTTFAYSKSGLTTTSWLAAWNGYELRAIAPTYVKSVLSLTKSDVGLGNVDNTSDANKPISTATQTALNGKVNKSGDTMTGQLKTSFKNSVAIGSLAATSNTIPDLCNELRYSSGCMGSVNISTEYTLNNITISPKWYNFIWVPHRTGGLNGGEAGDNHNYGTLYLSGMTGDGWYVIRFYSGSISTLQLVVNSNLAEANGGTDLTLVTTGDKYKWNANIYGLATNTAKGLMSADDKKKLDQITVSDIGTVGANSIIGEKDIKVSISDGVATIGHANTAITAGTVSGTSNSGNVAFGSTVTIPKITYDAYGHITGATTTTFKLPEKPTDISGNAATATNATTADKARYLWSLGRITSANLQTPDNLSRMSWALASSSMTEAKPPAGDGYITTWHWDNSGWGAQLYLRHNKTDPYPMVRGATSGTGNASDWGDWIPLLTSVNYTSYTVKKDGTGASGTWGISITGNAATATSATSATSAGSATKSGVANIWMYPENNNEINFGGTNASTQIFVGYRAKDSRAIPTKFIFGGANGSSDLQAKTVYLGSGTTSYISSSNYTGKAATAGTADSATSATYVGSFSVASVMNVDRYVWMSWSDNGSRPAYHAKLTYNTQTDTLKTPKAQFDDWVISEDTATKALCFSFVG